jgi:hypothetical protein
VSVTLADGKFVQHAALVDFQSTAYALGPVPANLMHFNDEAVKVKLNLPKAKNTKEILRTGIISIS